MIGLICFLLACYGVTNIITGGKIFEWLRRFLKPFPIFGYWIECPMCVGVPVGVIWCWVGLRPGTGLPFWWDIAASGCISSAWCWMTRVVLHRLGEDEL